MPGVYTFLTEVVKALRYQQDLDMRIERESRGAVDAQFRSLDQLLANVAAVDMVFTHVSYACGAARVWFAETIWFVAPAS